MLCNQEALDQKGLPQKFLIWPDVQSAGVLLRSHKIQESGIRKLFWTRRLAPTEYSELLHKSGIPEAIGSGHLEVRNQESGKYTVGKLRWPKWLLVVAKNDCCWWPKWLLLVAKKWLLVKLEAFCAG